MNCFLASQARDNLYRLIDQVAETHDPVIIKGKRNEAILISNNTLAIVHNKL